MLPLPSVHLKISSGASKFVHTIICMFVGPRCIIIIIVLIVISFCFGVSLVYFVTIILTVTYYECNWRHRSDKNILEVRIRKREGAQLDGCGGVPPARGMSKAQNPRADHQDDDDKDLNYTQNGILGNLMGRGLTSTPLGPSPHNRSVFFSPSQSTRISSASRYSLSDNSLLTPTQQNPAPKAVHKINGPLLASTQFNINLGTYTDSKSPGLSSRIVQYDKETLTYDICHLSS